MKKAVALLIIIATLICMSACGGGFYDAIPSTEEEARTVMTFSLEGKTYEVKYEVYRALFLNLKSEIDGGDASVWSGENKNAYIERANEKITDMLAYIYSAFAICNRIGFDVYSDSVNTQISEYIKSAVDGEVYGGDYEKYLTDLKADNLNYSAHELILRWGIATDAIDEYYLGTVSADDISGQITVGNLTYNREDVENFYFSEDCVRVIRGCIADNGIRPTPDRAEDLRDRVLSVVHLGDEAVAAAMAGAGSITAQAELQNGFVIGKYNLNRFYYGEMTEVSFDTPIGGVSEVITVVEDMGERCYVIYRTEKSAEHFDSCYGEIAYTFLSDSVGEILHTAELQLLESVSTTDVLKNLDYSKISMEPEE